MKLNDVVNDVDSRMEKIQKRLAESFNFDITKYKAANPKQISEKIRKIESRSDFSKHLKNKEWQRLSLIREFIELMEKKGQMGQSKGDAAHEKMWKKMDQSGNSKGFKGGAPKPVEDKYSAMAKKRGLGESGQNQFVALMESELERAEIVLAARNIVDEIQDMIQDLSKTKVEKLSPLVDRVKAEFGLDLAESFNTTVSTQLDSALESLAAVKDSIDTESLKLSGDVEPEAVSDFGDAGMEPEIDAIDDLEVDGADISIEPTDDLEDIDVGPVEPTDRELKESKFAADLDETKPIKVSGTKGTKSTSFTKKFKNMAAYEKWVDSDAYDDYSVSRVENVAESKISVRVETVSGRKGTKFFESRTAMRTWLNENEDKIKTVLEVR